MNRMDKTNSGNILFYFILFYFVLFCFFCWLVLFGFVLFEIQDVGDHHG